MRSTTALALLGVGAAFVAVTALALAQAHDPDSGLRKSLALYVAAISRALRGLFVFFDPRLVLVGQLVFAYAAAALAIFARRVEVALAIPLVMVGPVIVLRALADRRRRRAEEQVPTFALALANALRSTPSVGDALRSVESVISEPLRSETGLALKETRLGRTTAEALEEMGRRVQSRALDTTLAAVTLGQETGGNLPKTLEALASALRELQRLEANLRSKTAALRAQVWVVGLAPILFMIVLEKMQAGYFDPMLASVPGRLAAGLAALLWAAAIVLARRILAVKV